ncbi:MAG: protein kinase domain-containing protein [Planctomycetota bacterium]|jgi:serine/threonine protein kinase/tetratricopeptide (TPR) repeat protein
MSAERAEQAQAIFFGALDLPVEQRELFLCEQCGDDAELRAEVELLLTNDAATDDFMASPVAERRMQTTAAQPGLPVGTRIGSYELRQVIGTGGMGAVYEAVQDHPHRLVALKVLRRGFISRSALRRFKHEAEILGRLRHPNIAQVHDAGTFDDGQGAQPYFAMELIKGRLLLDYAESQDLGTRARLELFVKVCDAVQHAHLKGVIHRDLKPDNVLVDEHGEPKILDFGVARATDADIQVTTIRTDVGELIGTVPYMSPEQVAGDPEELDTRSDVYSLGVVLYELLTGRLPHNVRGKTIPEAVRIIGEEDPSRLSTIDRSFRGDLDTIVAKTLEKEKDRRYQSARDLAADVRRYLHDEPIVARPASTFYQLRKFAQRNKVLVGGITGMMLVLLSGATVSTIGFVQARTEANKVGLVIEFLEEVLTSPDPSLRGKHDLTVAELMENAAPRIDERFEFHPEIAARIKTTVGRTFLHIGWYVEAQAQLRDAYEQSRELNGEDDPRTLVAQQELITVLSYRGAPEAVDLGRDLVQRMQRVHGRDHPDTIMAMVRLGDVVGYVEGSLGEAEAILREAHTLAFRVLDEDAGVRGEAAFWLANVLHFQFRPAEAEQFARQFVAWCRRTQADPLSTARSLTELAYILGLLGQTDEGFDLVQESLQIHTESLSPTSAGHAVTLYVAGLILQWGSRSEEAETYFERCRGLWDLGHMTATPRMADFFLARCRVLQGRITPAEALPIVEKFVRDRPWPTEFGIPATAWCLVKLGRYDEADQLMQRCPGRLAEGVPHDHFERRLYLETQLGIYEGLGRREKAAEYRALLREAESADEASE